MKRRKIMIDMTLIKNTDPEIYAAMQDELCRQRENIELIASENIVSPAVMAAMGSHLTNKYAEGLPSKRYYGGCQYVDVAENLARDRLKELFGCDHCNVQPHSGAQANFAVYFAMLKKNYVVMIVILVWMVSGVEKSIKPPQRCYLCVVSDVLFTLCSIRH